VVPTDPDPSARALSFGSVAADYERYRMGYPEELVRAVLRYAGRDVRTALEVGAGTGKATRLFGAHGIQVTALEPDADMARVLRRTARGLPVRTMVVAFEAFRAAERFDLLYATAAWHWTDPAVRWTRAVDLLAPGGVLALVGRPDRIADPELAAAVDEVEHRVLPAVDEPAGTPWTIDDVRGVDGLTDVERQELPRATTVSAAEWAQRLGTASVYLLLEPTQRVAALRQIRAVLPDRVDIDCTVQLTLARRR
jgi:SAM-dependent methyltransferase